MLRLVTWSEEHPDTVYDPVALFGANIPTATDCLALGANSIVSIMARLLLQLPNMKCAHNGVAVDAVFEMSEDTSKALDIQLEHQGIDFPKAGQARTFRCVPLNITGEA